MRRGRRMCGWLLVAGALAAPATATAERGWTAPFALGVHAEGTATGPDGTVVAWGTRAAAGPALVVQVRPPGGPALEPQVLGAAGLFNGIDVAVGPAGFVAGWSADGNVHTARMAPGETAFSDVRTLPSTGQPGHDVEVGIEADGHAHIVWTSRAGAHHLRYGTRPVSADEAPELGTLYSAHNAAPLQREVFIEDLAVGAGGHAVLLWRVTTYNSSTGNWSVALYSNPKPPGAAWYGGVNLAVADRPVSGASRMIEEAEAVMSDAGIGAVAWAVKSDPGNGDPATRAITLRRLDGVALDVPVDPAAGSGLTDARRPVLAVDGAGVLRVAWIATQLLDPRAQTRSYSPAGAAGPLQTFGTRSFPYSRVRLAAGAAGQASLVLEHQDSGTCTYRIAQAEADAPFGASTDLLTPTECGEMQASIGSGGDGLMTVTHPAANGTSTGVGLDGAPPRLALRVPASANVDTPVELAVDVLDTWSEVVSTTWSFDDGTTADGATTEHAWATPGEREVTVTATDALGNSASRTATVAVTAPAPPPAAPDGPGGPAPGDPVSGGSPAAVADLTPPALARLRYRRRALHFALGEAARVRLVVRRIGRRKPVTVRSPQLAAGTRRVPLRLRPGRYRATLVAVDAAGNRSRRSSVRFRVPR